MSAVPEPFPENNELIYRAQKFKSRAVEKESRIVAGK